MSYVTYLLKPDVKLHLVRESGIYLVSFKTGTDHWRYYYQSEVFIYIIQYHS